MEVYAVLREGAKAGCEHDDVKSVELRLQRIPDSRPYEGLFPHDRLFFTLV